MKRFLDDIFQIFVGSTKMLHKIFQDINNIHPNIKFTISHTLIQNESEESRCSCIPQESIPFLDTSCKIENGKIILDLYKKPTDRNMYLLPSSCHPPHQTSNIPYSLAMRINRVCTKPDTRDHRLEELRRFLLDRQYIPGVVDTAINRARAVPREKALQYVVKPKQSRRPVFVVPWDPRLPSIDAIQQKHWRAMITLDPYLKEVFPEPPITAYKKQKNIKDLLIRARVHPTNKTRQRRYIKGMKKCKGCIICPFITERKTLKYNNLIWKIATPISCKSNNLVYLIECEKERCKQKYIGETERPLKDRISEHISYIRSKNITQATGFHFNLPGTV